MRCYPHPVFEELLADLDDANVRFVVVGGLAVVIQGYARLTADVDLVIDLDSSNVLRAVQSPGDAMASDPALEQSSVDDTWRADFRSAEERLLDASLAATPSQRLKWLEEALAFAARMNALPPRDYDSGR
jgi:hypothetical protein